MKKTLLINAILSLCILLSCCGGNKFDDPVMQANFDAIKLALEEKDWDALVSDTDWYSMRNEDAVRRLAAKKLTAFMKEDDLDSARKLLTAMPIDYIDGNGYYATPDFMSWMVNRFANDGTRFVKEPGMGGYYDTHASELAQYTNYDELNDVEYVSTVWYSGDFALNIYTSRVRSTGELTADHSVGLYVAGTCVYLTNDSTENINGEALLKGYMTNGSYYGHDGYILCNVGSSCLAHFILADCTDGGYCTVSTQNEHYSERPYKIG